MTINLNRHEAELDRIAQERKRQEQMKREGRFAHTCADAGMGNADRLACLAEEMGEVAQEVLTQKGRRLARDTTGTVEGLRKEVTQVAAVCLAWLESECNAEPEGTEL
jgi:NTP pyrophosphatase (non-canonical NTP hydrolase)